MSKIDMIRELPKKIKAFSIYTALLIAPLSLTSCKNTKNNTTPTTIENPVSPTDAVTPTSEITVTPTGVSVTPTGVVTPEPTITVEPTKVPTPTVAPTPTPALAEKKLSSADIWSKEFVETEYFDTNKPVEEQIEDRKDLLESYDVLNNNQVEVLVKCINKETTNEAMTQEEINELATAVKEVYKHNQSNPNEMIPLSQLGIDLSKEEREAYNNVQCISYKMTSELPANATTDNIYAYRDANFFLQLSYGGDKPLSISTVDGDQKSSEYIDIKSLDPSCRIVMYMYALEALKPYKSDVMTVRRECITEHLNKDTELLKTRESNKQLTK